VAEVKKGITAWNKPPDDGKTAGGEGEKKNQMTPGTGEPPPGSQVFYYCDNPAGYYPQVPNCSMPWRTVVTGSNGPPPPDQAPPESGPNVVPGFGFGGFGFGFGGGGGGSDDGQSGRGTRQPQTRRP
jgi:hypothetical protein